MASISQAASEEMDYARTLFVVETLQGAREVVPIRFTTSGRPDDIADWHFTVSAEFGYAYIDTDAAGKTVLSGSAIASRQPAIAVPTIERDALRSNAVDLVIPPNLLVGDIPLDASPSHVVFLWLSVRKGSEVDAPETSVWRIPVVVRRGETGVVATAPTSPTSPTEPVTLDAEDIRDELMSLQGGDRLDASAVKNLPSGGAGLDQSAVDARIMTLRPRIFTASDETKLDGIEENATADQTPTEIRDAIQGLSGANRLSYNNLKDQPTIPTPRTNAEIDGRIISTARTGNTSRWAKLKLPADTIYTATQRFTTALLSKLNGIENNAKDDQSPTEIRDALAGLSGNARLAASAIQGLPSSSGSASSLWTLMAQPASDVVVAQPANNTDWGDWNDLATTGAVATGNAGQVVFGADCHVVVAGTGSSGGDRCFTEFRVVRTRGSTDTTLLQENIYGPRNGTNFGGIAVAASSAASGSLIGATTVQEGDTMKLQVRLAIQTTANTKSFTFAATRNEVFMAGVS